MKKNRDLHKELGKRRYKQPNPFYYGIYHAAAKTHFLGGKYHPHFEIIDSPADCKGPCFLIWNHQSRRDHAFLALAAWPRRISIVCEYNEFFRSHLHWALKKNGILPKKVFTFDMAGIRAMRDVIKDGGCVAFSPEGTSSLFGDNQPIVVGTGRFLKSFKVPVYCMSLQGSYLTNNKISENDRIGEVYGQMRLLFSQEDLERLSGEEIDKIINEQFRHDDYKWNKEKHIKYDSKGKLCDNLSDMLYWCPRCGNEFTMESKGHAIKCRHCGNGANMDDYYDFHPFDESCLIPETPSDWVHLERKKIIDEIRKDDKYLFKTHLKIGYLPKDHYVDKKHTSEICGEGDFNIDHSGVHFRGTRFGEPWSFDLGYSVISTYPMSVDLSMFSYYIDGDYYDFIPEERVVSKIIMLTEEMHRLHVNEWKNFPWFDYMYEGLELGIDSKDK